MATIRCLRNDCISWRRHNICANDLKHKATDTAGKRLNVTKKIFCIFHEAKDAENRKQLKSRTTYRDSHSVRF